MVATPSLLLDYTAISNPWHFPHNIDIETPGGVLWFFPWSQHLPVTPKNIRNIKRPKKIFEILATPQKYPNSVPLTLKKDPKMQRNEPIKLAQFCDDPHKNLHTPKKLFFWKPQKIMKFRILNPPKNSPSLRMRENIRVPPPAPPGIETMHKLKTAHSFSQLSPALFRGWGGMVTNGWCIKYSYQHPWKNRMLISFNVNPVLYTVGTIITISVICSGRAQDENKRQWLSGRHWPDAEVNQVLLFFLKFLSKIYPYSSARKISLW